MELRHMQLFFLVLLCLGLDPAPTHGHIWAWMLSIPYSPAEDRPLEARVTAGPAHEPLFVVACEHDRACSRGFYCDRHFGLCAPLKQAGQYCRRDAQCARGLTCMFGKCHHRIPEGQEGARCKTDRDCESSMCCARHHGEQVCKRRLAHGELCFVPDGGIAFSINQICPCDEGLLCRSSMDTQHREMEFVYHQAPTSWTCQALKP